MTAISGSERLSVIGRNAAVSGLISIAYLLVSYWLIGFRPEQVVLAGLFFVMFNLSVVTRNFIVGFSIFIVYWIIFDYMKAFPNYKYHEVDLSQLYTLEKQLFGISVSGVILSPNEYWLANHNAILDILTGIFYLCWIPVPLLMGTYLFFTRRAEFFHFSLTFLTVNLIGFVIYYSHPVAPPWYLQVYGPKFLPHVPGNTAGLGRFDHFLGITLFKSIYEKSSNVFAAMPSLHSAYPLIVLYYGVKNKLGKVNIPLATVMVGIWFAAVYTSHHFVLDVLAGITCAVCGITLFNTVLRKSEWLPAFVARMVRATTAKT